MQLLPNQDEVYQTALANRPEIQSSKLSIDNSKLAISAAKSGYYPSISLSASTSSMTNNASQNNWAQQMKYGWNNMIGLTVSVPIFNNRQTKSAVEKLSSNTILHCWTCRTSKRALHRDWNTLAGCAQCTATICSSWSETEKQPDQFDMVSEQFRLGMKIQSNCWPRK